MREQLERRLDELKTEFETGQKMMMELEQKRANLEKTLLRISGAIQVLEEELNKEPEAAAAAPAGPSAAAGLVIDSNNHHPA